MESENKHTCLCCGEEIADGKMFCDICQCFVSELSQHQIRALEKLLSHEAARMEFNARMLDIKMRFIFAIEPIRECIGNIIDRYRFPYPPKDE